MQEFLTQTGRSIYLAKKFASGGEGEIYEINNSPELLAKIYLPAILQKRQRELEKKLPLMISLTNDLLLSNAAWPLDALYEKKSRRLVGFVMKKFEGHKEIHLLYSPKSRIREFPDAGWSLLVHTAINITRTFELIHNHGHVIGDINAKSVLVSKQAITKLIDCDSFQINTGTQPLTCDVGVPEYTPPELQGKSLHGLVRNQSQDAFGLAVLIFHLLFMGRHPFAGEYLGQDNKDLADSIREYRFAYGPGASSRNVRQPPISPPLTIVSDEVAALFERAFTTANRRPSTSEWASGLRNLSQNLTKCGVNTGHHYLRSLSECPWCKLERTAGLKLFLGAILQNLGTAGFDLAKVWQEISAIVLPPDSFPATAHQIFQPTLGQLLNPFGTAKSVGISPEIATVQRILLAANLAILLWIAGSIWWVLNPVETGLLGCVVAFFCLLLPYQNYARQKKLLETEKNLIDARSNQGRLLAQFQTGRQAFQQKQAELSKIKQQYENLGVELHRKLADLEKNSNQRQLEKFLDSFDLYDASIAGIGPQRKATLISFGVETAADVHYSKIQGVIPGFGPGNTGKLVAWRQSLERQFVYDARKGVDPADKQAVEQEIASKRRAFEVELGTGPIRLKQFVEQITNTQNQGRKDIELTAKDREEVQKKIGFLLSLRKGFVPLWGAMIGLTIWWLSTISSSPVAQKIQTAPTQAVQPASPLKSYSEPQAAEKNAEIATDLYTQGISHTKSRQFEKAAALYQQAITINPDYAEAHHELGYALFRLRRYDEAITACQKAIQLRPTFVDTHRNLAQCYAAKGDLANQIATLETAIKLAPKHIETINQLAEALFQKKDYEEAGTHFIKVLELNPERAKAWYKLGIIFLKIGEPEKAQEVLEELRILNPAIAESLANEIIKVGAENRDIERGSRPRRILRN